MPSEKAKEAARVYFSLSDRDTDTDHHYYATGWDAGHESQQETITYLQDTLDDKVMLIENQQETLNEQGKYIARLEEEFKANGETIEKLKEGLEKITRIANGGNRLDDIAWRNAYHTANDLLQPLNK